MQETDKHGQRIDDQLKHETESLTHGAGIEARSQEARLQQGGEPLPNPADRPDVADAGGLGIPSDEVDQRAELAMAVKPASFPATGETLLETAASQQASDAVMRRLSQLPPGRLFENVQEVWENTGGDVEPPHTGHHS